MTVDALKNLFKRRDVEDSLSDNTEIRIFYKPELNGEWQTKRLARWYRSLAHPTCWHSTRNSEQFIKRP